MSLGGTLIFIALALEYWPEISQAELWFWPLCALLALFVAQLQLRRLYRLEPARQPGLYQLSLVDLLAASLLAGLTGTICHWAHCAAGAVALVPFVAVAFTFGVLIATRRGLKAIGWKYLYALAYLIFIYGLAGLAGSVALVVVSIMYGEAPRILNDIFSLKSSFYYWPWIAWLSGPLLSLYRRAGWLAAGLERSDSPYAACAPEKTMVVPLGDGRRGNSNIRRSGDKIRKLSSRKRTLVMAGLHACRCVAPFWLRRLYRREPAQHPGLFHLHLIDLLVATLLAGLTGTLCHWAHFVAEAVVLSPLIAVGFTLGVLVATRIGISSIDRKYLYAVAYLAYVFGLAGITGWIVVLVASIPYGATLDVLSETFFANGLPPCWRLVMWCIRASFVTLPAGWLACRWLEKKRNL